MCGLRRPFFCFLAFVPVVLQMDTGWAARTPDGNRVPAWPKELDTALARYQSAKFRSVIIENVRKSEGENGDVAAKAVTLLLDLRDPDISTWLLTKSRASGIAILDDLPKRKFAVDDGFYLIRSQMFHYEIFGPGFQRRIGRWRRASELGQALCRGLDVKYVPPAAFTKKGLRAFAQDAIERSLKKHAHEPIMTLKLKILKIQIDGLMN